MAIANCTLPTLDAYDRWAATYPPTPHNPLMRAEQNAMLAQWPDVTGRRALDLACGTGRYAKLLAEGGAGEVFCVDFSASMLRQVSAGSRVLADMMRLPFIDAAFEVVISGLALGHAIDVRRWMREVGRVLGAGGELLYSDFHPEAARAGLTRSFKDERHRSVTVSHCTYGLHAQREALAAASLKVEAVTEIRVGVELQEVFPGSDAFYRQWRNLPLLVIVRARK
jgi:malonyl-CoA O-methyltransferase